MFIRHYTMARFTKSIKKNQIIHPPGIYLFKVNNGKLEQCVNLFKVCSKDITGVFIINFKHISHTVSIFSLFTLKKY